MTQHRDGSSIQCSLAASSKSLIPDVLLVFALSILIVVVTVMVGTDNNKS